MWRACADGTVDRVAPRSDVLARFWLRTGAMKRRLPLEPGDLATAILAVTPAAAVALALLVGAWLSSFAP